MMIAKPETTVLAFAAMTLLCAGVPVCQATSTAGAAKSSADKSAGGKRLRYEDTRRRIRWESSVPPANWARDGLQVRVRDGEDWVWLEPRSGTRSESAPPKKESPAKAAAAPRKIAIVADDALWLDEAGASRAGAGRRGRPSARSRKPSAKAVRVCDLDPALGAAREIHVAPGGASVSFVRGNNLFFASAQPEKAQTQKVETQKVQPQSAKTQDIWQATTDGGPEQFHGLLDWVYQEELYGRGNFQAHWWSPNGAMCAFLSLDESPVREFTVVDHVPPKFLDEERTVRTENTNYPKAGDPNPFASLRVAHVGSKTFTAVDLSRFPKDLLVVRVGWTPDGETLLVTVQDRIQTWAELCGVDPKTGAITTWIREESDTWVNRPSSPRWLADGTFLWMSERTGYQHVYRYQKGGKLLSTATAGEWQVRSIARVDEQGERLWFEGTKDGATGRHLYRVGFDGQGLVSLTPGIGTHSFSLNPDASMVLDRWSSMEHPTIVRVLDGETGEVLNTLGQGDRGSAKDYAFSEKKRVTIAARDGYPLDASVQLPVDYEAGKRYPVYLPTYSGPDAPSVRDRWSHASYSQFLSQQGFVILQVNVRSASGRGQKHTGTCYQQLGVQELKDLEDAVDHVCREFGGDPERVAISGWSYGGFMSAYALTHSKKFALGLAGAGVHDWRLYDTIYTERYMRTPQENSKGYDETSVVKAAKNLHGHLVLIHGTMDDNVHMQNSMQLLWELQKAGKQNVELMVYPRSRHGLNRQVSPHSREFQWRRLQKLLVP
ncbi:MAG: DPP IV N-terminal domain-containing protein [Planctomycetota bacterium]